MGAPGDFEFDGWRLLRASGELCKEGRKVRLPDQPLQVLIELLERPGELVTREQLITRLWPKQIVEFDTGLNAVVRKLRIALDDDPDAPRYIETIPRRGYRFIGAVGGTSNRSMADAERPSELPADTIHPSVSPWTVLLGFGVVTIIALAWFAALPKADRKADGSRSSGDRPAIVVMPFVDLTGDDGSAAFVDGLTEELIHRLSRNDDLRVIARTSSFALRGQGADIAAIAKQLNVSHVLEGSVRRSADRLRVTAQLIDAYSSAHVWSETYDRRTGEFFGIQDDIATAVAATLDIALVDSRRPGPPPDPAAYDNLLLGRFFYNRRGPGDLERSRKHLETAISLEPRMAEAHAALAGVYWVQVADGEIERRIGFAKLQAAAQRAIALDPALAEPHMRLANVAWANGNVDDMRKHKRLGSELEPNHPLVIADRIATAIDEGRNDDAINLLSTVVERDPLSVVTRYNFAWTLYTVGRYEEALTQMRRVTDLNPQNSRFISCASLVLLGRAAEARDLAKKWQDQQDKLRCESLAHHTLGEHAKSDAALARLEADWVTSGPFALAEIRAWRGETEEAFRWLAKSESHCLSTSKIPAECKERARRDSPLLASLHLDPQWADWIGDNT